MAGGCFSRISSQSSLFFSVAVMNSCDRILIWIRTIGICLLDQIPHFVHVQDADGRMGWFAPFGVKSRYLLAFCHLSIALALLYHLGTVVFAYFTGTCEGARACTTSIPVPYSPRTLPVPVFVAPVFVVRSPQHRRHWGREFSLHDRGAEVKRGAMALRSYLS